MARKKRRGRPPGSKNQPKFAGTVAKMDVAQLSDYIESLRKTLAKRVQQQREYFERQLASLGVDGSGDRGLYAAGARSASPRSGTRRKPEPKYQSKKNPRLKWTGRGMLPVWMRDEMKGSRLKKDDFLIK
jgi:DNA-binding protein H-NS